MPKAGEKDEREERKINRKGRKESRTEKNKRNAHCSVTMHCTNGSRLVIRL
jgi:hypothetical protein